MTAAPETAPPDDAAKSKRKLRRELLPALLGRLVAAPFVSLSASAFDRLNAAGGCPAPVRLGGRLAWSRRELQAWVDRGCPDRATWAAVWPAIRDRRPGRK